MVGAESTVNWKLTGLKVDAYPKGSLGEGVSASVSNMSAEVIHPTGTDSLQTKLAWSKPGLTRGDYTIMITTHSAYVGSDPACPGTSYQGAETEVALNGSG